MRFLLFLLVLVCLPSVFAIEGQTQTVSKLWNTVNSGDLVEAEFRATDLAFRSIEFTATEAIYPAKIEVYGRERKLFNAPESELEYVYQYVHVEDNIRGRSSLMKVDFLVPSLWLEDNGFVVDDLVVQSLQGDVWTNLSYNHSLSKGDYLLSVEVPSLTEYAIGAEKVFPVVVEEELVVVEEPVENESVVEEIIDEVVFVKESPVEEPSEPFKMPSWVWIVLLVIVVIALVALGLEYLSRKKLQEFGK